MASYRDHRRYRLRALVWTHVAALIAALCLVAVAGDAWAANLQRLEIATKSGPRAFLVEVATTDDEKNTGLMNRGELPDGRILRVAQNIEPLSTIAIPSGGIVKGVLEVMGGTAKKYGIGPGDRVEHPLFAGDH